MKYGKIINRQLVRATRFENNVSNPTEEMLIEFGFKPIIEPTVEQGFMKGGLIETENSITWEVVEIPPIPKIFDIYKFKDDVKVIFGERMFEIDARWGVMSDNLKTPMLPEHFLTIKAFMYGWLNLGKINQDDFDKWVQCFINQDIDIINYGNN